MALIGQGALILALLIAVYAAGASLWAATGHDRRFLVSARHALWGIFALVLVAADQRDGREGFGEGLVEHLGRH